MRKAGLIITLTMVFFCGGCSIIGFMLSPGAYEKKIPAEYELAGHAKQKILVLVNQPGWLNAQANLRYYLTDAINKNLIRNIRISSKNFVTYDELSNYRSGQPNFLQLSPVEISKALRADVVLAVAIEDSQLTELGQTGYYKAHLYARAALFDTLTGTKLWPSEDSRSIKVGFEAEGYNREMAIQRLVIACAHCITRYLYPCYIDNFKIADDMSSLGWESWNLN